MNSPHIESNVPYRSDGFGRCGGPRIELPAMAMKQTAETWIRIDLSCDGLGDDGVCVRDANDGRGMISDVAPTEEGARKGILNAAVKSRWWFDPQLQRGLCPDCVAARDSGKDLGSGSGHAREARSTTSIDTAAAAGA